MKISTLINELNNVKDKFGEIEVCLEQSENGIITGYEGFFVLPEEYENDKDDTKETVCNIRTWPY